VLKYYPEIFVIAIDQDEKNLKKAKKNLAKYSSRIKFIKSNFENIKQILQKLDLL